MREGELQRARGRATTLYRSHGFRMAYMAGARARVAGHGESVCPYAADGKGTWRRTWRAAWLRGYQSVSSR